LKNPPKIIFLPKPLNSKAETLYEKLPSLASPTLAPGKKTSFCFFDSRKVKFAYAKF